MIHAATDMYTTYSGRVMGLIWVLQWPETRRTQVDVELDEPGDMNSPRKSDRIWINRRP